MISIIHNSVFITHNSKYVSPTADKCVWHHNSIFVSFIQFFDFWVMGYENWKHILDIFNFQNSIFNSNFVILQHRRVPLSVSCPTERTFCLYSLLLSSPFPYFLTSFSLNHPWSINGYRRQRSWRPSSSRPYTPPPFIQTSTPRPLDQPLLPFRLTGLARGLLRTRSHLRRPHTHHRQHPRPPPFSATCRWLQRRPWPPRPRQVPPSWHCCHQFWRRQLWKRGRLRRRAFSRCSTPSFRY